MAKTVKISINKVKGSGYAIIASGEGIQQESKFYPKREDAFKVAKKISRRLRERGYKVKVG